MYRSIDTKLKDLTSNLHRTRESFKELIVAVKDNKDRCCELHFKRIAKFRLWKQWHSVRFQDYIKQQLQLEYKQIHQSIKQKRAIQKWFLRTKQT